MSRRVRLALLTGAALLGSIGAAGAFVPFRSRWNGATAHFRVSERSFPAGTPQLSVTQASFETWNQLPGCDFNFTHATSSDTRAAADHNDGVSGIAFSSGVQGSTLGVCFSDDIGRRRRSADVLFNASTTWSFDGTPSRREFDYGSTCRHEIGHALGLQHSDRGCRALMGGGCGSPAGSAP